jgi:lysophospholipase L1-like esterase
MMNMAKSIHYLAFGDSLTVGYGALRHQGFAYLLKGKMDELAGIPVDFSNAGANGATTGRLLDILETETELIQLMKHANVITITAGGNDLIQAALPYIQGGDSSLLKSALQDYEMNYSRILKQIQQRRTGVLMDCTATSRAQTV